VEVGFIGFFSGPPEGPNIAIICPSSVHNAHVLKCCVLFAQQLLKSGL